MRTATRKGDSMARIIDGTQKNIIGEKVKKLRKEKKLSQQQLSDRLETLAIYICRGSVSRIEDCSRTVTDIELYGLSKVLDVPIEDFFK
jgi:transcriptional regulator with XRE-family HTH domain